MLKSLANFYLTYFQEPECLTTGHGQPLWDKLNFTCYLAHVFRTRSV
jgi:hypothetical protein